ncbi:MAG: alcohol dehydrogenase catalytic domain-containing protein [Candidatus Bathyarchaeota archaeon]|nr:alcohol dehydrogenase catalytic domain-containing protein [Candidatus Termiticorpusculum sp.]MCL1970953.1 alcohol dehydrogenase catalytic domain-containing protein [Candidatus Termiticorpusculum sp.]
MRALILDGNKKIRSATDVQVPNCAKGEEEELVLRVKYCSICRTDAKMWFQGQRDLVLPRILGHEICGQKLDSERYYVVWPANTCKKCYYCKNGVENLCSSIQVIGFHRDGGFAEYIKVPKEALIEVPKNVPPEIACMTELLSSAINAVEQVKLQEKQRVLIFGGGPAGLMLGLAGKFFGSEPFIVEKNPEKVRHIEQFCKNANIHLSNAAIGKFDVAINATSDPSTLEAGVLKLNAGGKYCLFSGFTKNVNITSDLLNEIHYRQLTVIGAYGSTKRQMEIALKILESNTETIKLLIHRVISLESVPSVLPEILRGQTLKYVIDLQKSEREDVDGN